VYSRRVAWAGHWWFWVAVAALAAGSLALGRAYPAFAARTRRAALDRGLVSLPAGQRLARARPRRWSDLSWLAIPVGLWVGCSPWIWGYDDASGAIATDVVTALAIIAVGLAAIVFPALLALELVAGLWLVMAAWLVGFGDAAGPVGISDTLAGVVLCAAVVSGLASAERSALTARGGGGVGRVRRREGS
jgi:hypothetical protein